VRRYGPEFIEAFEFRSTQASQELLKAVTLQLSFHGSGRDLLDPFYRASNLQHGGVLPDCPVCFWQGRSPG
jgi:hypothetical protein